MAVKYYAGNKLTGVASDTKPTSNIIDGSTFFVTDTEDLFMYDLGTTSWKVVSGNTIAETLSSKTLTSPVLNGTLSGTAFLDEDNFASDSAIAVASQQSIKAYVASQVPGSQNVFNTIAVSGQDNIVADAATDTLTFAAGTNITLTTTAGSDTITIASASGVTALNGLSDVTIASAADAHLLIYDNSDSRFENKAVSGDITINAAGVTAIGSGVVVNADINASAAIAMSKTALVAGTGITLATNTLNVDAAQTQITSVGALDAGSITSGFGTIDTGSSAITTTGAVTGGTLVGTLTTAAQTNVTSVGALNAGSITSGFGTIDTGSSNITTTGTVTAGNLTVNGTTTTVNSTTVTIDDPIFTIGGDSAPGSDDNKDRGIEFRWHNGSAAKVGFFGFDDSTGKFTFIPDATNSSEVFSGSAGTVVAALEGNATTATTLATARTIGGTSFDGSANIAVALAATATTLASARTIGGTSFDGSANIVPATITVADTTDTTSFVALFESATGDLAPKTDAGITYNAGTGMLTATGVTAPLTGNVTGNLTGQVSTASQTSITSIANLATVGTIGTGVWNGTAIVQAYIGDQAINEAKLQVSNAPTNGYVLTARSGNTGGMTWESSSAAGASESFAIAMAVAL